MSDYIPIDCELYSLYELAIMHRQWLRVAWRHPDESIHLEILLPINLQTQNHAEYLQARTRDDVTLELRLDWIIRVEPR